MRLRVASFRERFGGVLCEKGEDGLVVRRGYLTFDAEFSENWFGRPRLPLTPNVVVTAYDRNDAGVRPRTDTYLRLTLFVDFE